MQTPLVSIAYAHLLSTWINSSRCSLQYISSQENCKMPRRWKDGCDSTTKECVNGTTGDHKHSKLSKLHKPVQRSAANARERSRMRVLSKAFSKLKTTLPWVPPDTKLSKLDTLRLASSYIAHLRQILDTEEVDPCRTTYIHPLNLVRNQVPIGLHF